LHSLTSLVSYRHTITMGDIYWVALQDPDDLAPRIRHPQVVVQPDVLHRSRIETVVVHGLTSNLRRANAPGNLLLEMGEANLPW